MYWHKDKNSILRIPGFYPYFVLIDSFQKSVKNFTGYYTLRVVGGGSGTEADLKLYTDEEIDKYNRQNSGSASLIWGPIAGDMDPAVPVFNNENNGIRYGQKH